ncbi:uncharacterized protein [Spinacia oleracea]|uniref:Uncharacterized protein n=1 Tax=Spinacia oleracea TaxID=3562 RepID=A0A9R0KDH5_SPIOL|nr:uncharacterized protein LOC110805648 [Spinacia oleracea]
MASVIMAKGTFIKVTNVGSPQAYLSPRKVSRVSFTSATTFNGNVAGYKSGRADRIIVKAEESSKQVGDVMQDAADKIKEGVETATKNAQEGADWAGKAISETHEKNVDSAEWAADKVKEEAGKAGDALQSAKESTEANLKEAHEKNKDTADLGADKVKEAADKAGEISKDVNSKVEEAAKGAWESAKDTAQKIQDKVEG